MEIKYEVDKRGLCLAVCPFDYPIRVGSMACAECRHRVSRDKEKQIVICNADQKTK